MLLVPALRRTLLAAVGSSSASFVSFSIASSSSRIASSSSSLPRLLSALSLDSRPSAVGVAASCGRRAFSTTPSLATPRPGMLRKKVHKIGGRQGPNAKLKTHKGAVARFRPYKSGKFKHMRAGRNQLNRKLSHGQRMETSVQLFCGKAQTRQLKKLMPYWRKTRRGGGW